MKKLYTIMLSIICMMSHTYAQINVQVPISYGSNQDQIANTGINVSSNSNVRISLLQLANSYLWVLLIVAIMVALIVTGFKLMSGKNEKSGIALMNGLIGILIAIFSYTVIRLLINLF